MCFLLRTGQSKTQRIIESDKSLHVILRTDSVKAWRRGVMDTCGTALFG
jgi:hypothetical protein